MGTVTLANNDFIPFSILIKTALKRLMERRVMEVPKSTPTAALFLELGILPVQYEIEKRQAK